MVLFVLFILTGIFYAFLLNATLYVHEKFEIYCQ